MPENSYSGNIKGLYSELMKSLSLVMLFFLMSCHWKKNAIKIKGSDTEVNLVVKLAEAFEKSHPDFYVSISGGGSGLGIASLMNGQADIATSSRLINNDEIALFKKKEISLDTFVFAEDAIAFVVSSKLPIDTICAEDLAKILSGGFGNWSNLIEQNLDVNIYGRQSNSGTHDFVKKTLGIEFSRSAKEMNGNAQIIEAIKADKSGIGYVGAGYVRHGTSSSRIKVLRIAKTRQSQAISPFDSKAIEERRYLFQRPLYQYILAKSANMAYPFIEFEKSSEGVAIIKASGYYPVLNRQ